MVTISSWRGDGEEALEKVKEHGDDIGVVMLDLTMPKMSGRDTFRNLRSGNYPFLPVVVCSGYLVDLDEFCRGNGREARGVCAEALRFRTSLHAPCVRSWMRTLGRPRKVVATSLERFRLSAKPV